MSWNSSWNPITRQQGAEVEDDPNIFSGSDDEEWGGWEVEIPPGVELEEIPVTQRGKASRRDLPQRTTSGALPDDLTFAEADCVHKTVAARKEEARKRQKKFSTSTQANYNSVERTWFNTFIEYARWDGVKKRVWVDEHGEITAEADGVFRRFFEWLSDAGVSKHTFKVRTPA